ncbi:MAG: hypothetical protein Q8K65_06215 [Alphaproteobacteria bacterium]|nr:hypothetical protein [Alphaproteobacteria bacterium]
MRKLPQPSAPPAAAAIDYDIERICFLCGEGFDGTVEDDMCDKCYAEAEG